MNGLVKNSSSLSVGIVGLANIGKSTFFQSITNSKLGNPGNYPFATIEPTHAITQIPNDKLNVLKRFYKADKVTPTTLAVVDIAGLTKGASEGKGLGNKFLNDIKHVDGIFHLVRGFKDDNVTHLETSVDPVRDLSLVQDELILKDLENIENALENDLKRVKNGMNSLDIRKELQLEIDLFTNLQEFLFNGQRISNYKKNEWTKEEIKILNKYNFLTSKPTLILLNVNEEDYILQKYESLKDIENWRDEFASEDKIILFSANFETKFNKFITNGNNDMQQLIDYYREIVQEPSIITTGLKSSVPSIIGSMKSLLNLVSFYTCGPKEIRQWNIPKGTSAKEAAGSIHTDLRDTFINANIIPYEDLENQKTHRVGKDYIMQDDDIAYFKAMKGRN